MKYKKGSKKQLLARIRALQRQIRNFERAVSRRKEAVEALKRSEVRFRQIAENALEWIWEVDINGLYTYASPKVKKILGYRPGEVVKKKHFYDFFHPAEREKLKALAFETFAKKTPFREFINRNIRKNGREVWLSTSGVPILDEGGNCLGYRGADMNITERKLTEKKLQQLVIRDSHTGLYNHRYLEEVIETEFNRARRHIQPVSVIMLDIDYFKSINDAYSHHFGDLVLKQFAGQLKRIVRQYDMIFRFGGEEFIILCPATERDDSLILARRILDAINLYNFGNKKHIIKLRVSIAVASCPEDIAARPSDLLELVDRILGKAKEHGGNRVYSSLDLQRAAPQDSEKVQKAAEVGILKEKISKLTRRANQSLIEAVFAFAKTIELKDHYTGWHVERTVRYATEIAKRYGLSKPEVERVRRAAILHDLGKIGIPEKLLRKKSRLTKKEFKEIKQHSQIAIDIIRPIKFFHDVIPPILHHHERWDGKGYPTGLKREEIPVGARIISLADAYQALTSRRTYRKAYSKEKALKIIKKETGTKFDPKIVNVFLKMLKKSRRKK